MVIVVLVVFVFQPFAVSSYPNRNLRMRMLRSMAAPTMLLSMEEPPLLTKGRGTQGD
jgi:hypothetical protein